ncbi:unnamed protein product [Sphagnum troendelagicum]
MIQGTYLLFKVHAIAEVDLNKCEPWDLPEKAKMGEKEWYFFSLRDRKYPTGMRTNRATEAGYWKATGKDKDVVTTSSSSTNPARRGASGMTPRLIGMKKTLVFYLGRAPKGEKTNWIMHEYRSEDDTITTLHHHHHHHSPRLSRDEWVVCRIFQKNVGSNKKPFFFAGDIRSSSYIASYNQVNDAHSSLPASRGDLQEEEEEEEEDHSPNPTVTDGGVCATDCETCNGMSNKPCYNCQEQLQETTANIMQNHHHHHQQQQQHGDMQIRTTASSFPWIIRSKSRAAVADHVSGSSVAGVWSPAGIEMMHNSSSTGKPAFFDPSSTTTSHVNLSRLMKQDSPQAAHVMLSKISSMKFDQQAAAAQQQSNRYRSTSTMRTKMEEAAAAAQDCCHGEDEAQSTQRSNYGATAATDQYATASWGAAAARANNGAVQALYEDGSSPYDHSPMQVAQLQSASFSGPDQSSCVSDSLYNCHADQDDEDHASELLLYNPNSNHDFHGISEIATAPVDSVPQSLWTYC